MTHGAVARLLELKLFEVDGANGMMLSASMRGHGPGFDAVTYVRTEAGRLAARDLS
jgi:hypothetical protein